jgi:RNA polymerase sigma-70 factor (ECF subfamily)
MDDSNLLLDMRRDRIQAFILILERYQDRVFGFVRALVGDENQAADITQDVFLVLLKDPQVYEPDRGTLLPFLLGIARNLALKEFRRERRELAAHDRAALQPVVLNAPPEADEPARLSKAVATLTSIQKQVVVLRFQQELSLGEISETLLLPLNTIKSHLKRAVDRLRSAFDQEDPHGL